MNVGSSKRGRRSVRFVAVLAAVAALTACGKVATDDSVEEQIKSQLGTDSSDCPTDLKGEQGQSILCKATKGDEAFDVKVTVTSVSGDTINFSIERVGGPVAATTAPQPPLSRRPSPGSPSRRASSPSSRPTASRSTR